MGRYVGITMQGILKMMEIELLQNIIPNYKPNTLRNTKPSRVNDPGAHLAQLMAIRATDKAIEKTRERTHCGAAID